MTAQTMQDPEIGRTLEILGGVAVFGRPIRTRLDAHDALEKGLPATALRHLVDEVGLLAGARGQLEKAIGISLRTFQRRRESDRPLSREQSSRAWKFAEILGRAADILGGRDEAEAWLQTPSPALDQRRPIDLLATQAGVEAVEDLLTRIEYGVYT